MGPEILVVDNDPLVCGLSNEILNEAGFTTRMVQDGRVAIAAIKEAMPRAVLLDILMPGVDGLSLCRTIKSDPALKNIKVIIVSGKTFEVEKERARRLGADAFIDKPYNVDTFAQAVIGIVGPPKSPAPAGQAPGAAPKRAAKLKIWGCRSNPPLGAPSKLLTPCVSLETEDHVLVFDAGSGIAPLGVDILKNPPAAHAGRAAGGKDVWLFLTHFHDAHVRGLGAFACSRDPQFNLRICGPNDPEKTLDQCVRESIQKSFASDPRPVKAKIQLYPLVEGDYDLAPGIRVRAFYTNHPSTTLGFSLETAGRRVVYCPDSEIYGGSATALQDYDEMLASLSRQASLLIHDARYAPEDYPAHKNQGHSDALETAEFAGGAGVERLMLFHQDASYSDAQVKAIEAKAQEALKAKNAATDCIAAAEGLELSF